MVSTTPSSGPVGYMSKLSRGIFLIEGKDASKVLKNLTTNNTDLLENGGPLLYSLMLTHQVLTPNPILPQGLNENLGSLSLSLSLSL